MGWDHCIEMTCFRFVSMCSVKGIISVSMFRTFPVPKYYPPKKQCRHFSALLFSVRVVHCKSIKFIPSPPPSPLDSSLIAELPSFVVCAVASCSAVFGASSCSGTWTVSIQSVDVNVPVDNSYSFISREIVCAYRQIHQPPRYSPRVVFCRRHSLEDWIPSIGSYPFRYWRTSRFYMIVNVNGGMMRFPWNRSTTVCSLFYLGWLQPRVRCTWQLGNLVPEWILLCPQRAQESGGKMDHLNNVKLH